MPALSEYEAKKLLKKAGIPVVKEYLAKSERDAVEYAKRIGFPVVLKACGKNIQHKTEKGLVKLNISGMAEVKKAYKELISKAEEMDGVLVQKMIKGDVELIAGMLRDRIFGPSVMLGMGGIYTEVIRDVVFRVAPVHEDDVREMVEELKMAKLLHGYRGIKPVDLKLLAGVLMALGELGLRDESIMEVDINPLLVGNGRPVAVDSIVILR